jgi:hypothetical protein
MKKTLALMAIGLSVIGCKKETDTPKTSAPFPAVTATPTVVTVNPVATTSTPAAKDQTALASYADFVKQAKQLKARLDSGMTHQEFDTKVGTLIDAFAVIDDAGTPLAQKAKDVVEQAKSAQGYWTGQDQVGVSDPQALPHFLTWVGNKVDAFLKAYSDRKGS